ncbi:MAG TPA: lytic transglycosylase domain-containing protein [Candidatus Polarisedimenticolia bacterium]|nr:lytic transglycosylase domain-containing protein [Candidatus Polarisedimenticolia bacterium]
MTPPDRVAYHHVTLTRFCKGGPMHVKASLYAKLDRLVRPALCLVLVAVTSVASSMLVEPAWAPEDPWRQVAELAVARGPRIEAAGLLDDLMRRHAVRLTDDQMLRIADAVAAESIRHRIDPGLLLSVILTESSFKADAVSHKGAIGLMQLLPSTAASIADELDVDWAGDFRLLDPQVNIAMGAYYLRKLLVIFDDDLNLALTAYNKGPGYVQNMLASGVMESTANNFPSSYAEKVVTGLGNLPGSDKRIAWVARPPRGLESGRASAL